jgi:RNA polymerase sigma factor (sigma-70 family)
LAVHFNNPRAIRGAGRQYKVEGNRSARTAVMAARPERLLHQLCQLTAPPASDPALLDRYVRDHDEAAFAALVERHGPLVWNVCRRVLGHAQDAEDAFQAAFLVLARKAGSIRPREALAAWLHGVAYRVACKARARRRPVVAAQEPADPRPDPLDELTARELLLILDEEVQRLPAAYRLPLVLCCLEGRTRDETARLLGWTPGSVKGRLERGRALLQARLARRGLAFSAVLASGAASAPRVPAALIRAAQASLIEAGEVSAGAAALADGVLRSLAAAQVKLGAALLLTAGVFAAGAGVAHQALTEPLVRDDAAADGPPVAVSPRPRVPASPPTDHYGDPLPAGALARLGTVRWRMDPGGVDCLIVVPDGKTLITANRRYGVSLWDVVTGKVTRRIPSDAGHRQQWLDAYGAVALAADGRTAAFSSADGVLHVVAIPTGRERQSCRGHQGRVTEAALSADGRILVSRGADHTLRVWDAAAGKELRRMALRQTPAMQGEPREIALSPDGRTLAWVGDEDDPSIHLAEALTGKETFCLSERQGDHRRLAFAPDGRKLLATGDLGPGHVWDVATGRSTFSWPRPPRSGRLLLSADFAPDGKTLVITDSGVALRLVDSTTGRELWSVPWRMMSTDAEKHAFTPDGKTLFAAWFEPIICRYDTSSGRRLYAPGELPGRFRQLAFGADGRSVYTLSDDAFHAQTGNSVLREWGAATGKELRRHQYAMRFGLLSPDGRWLAADRNGMVQMIETATGKETWPAATSRGEQPLLFSDDGRSLVLDDGRNIILRAAAGGKELRRIAVPSRQGFLHCEQGGRYLLGCEWTADVRKKSPVHVWDIATGREWSTFTVPGESLLTELSPDGRMLAVQMPPREGLAAPMLAIELRETATGQTRVVIERCNNSPAICCFSPDGSLLLVLEGSVIRFHDVRDGRAVLRLEEAHGIVGRFAFSPDGRKMLTYRWSAALVWDWPALRARCKPVPPERRGVSPPVRLLWSELAHADAARAYRALWALVANPEQSVPLLRENLRPAGAADARRTERWLRDLDSDDFSTRQQAAEALARLGDAAEPALRRALKVTPSAEVRRRVEQLLAKLDWRATPERLRLWRAIEALEHIDTPEARQVLKALAAGAAEAGLTQEAQAALARLEQRSAASH